jgi:hypothetical protein
LIYRYAAGKELLRKWPGSNVVLLSTWNQGCGRDFVGAGQPASSSKEVSSSEGGAAPLTEPPPRRSGQWRSAAASEAEGARTARVGQLAAAQRGPLPWEEQEPAVAAAAAAAGSEPAQSAPLSVPPLISIGLRRDPNILSEKNLLLVRQQTHDWTWSCYHD